MKYKIEFDFMPRGLYPAKARAWITSVCDDGSDGGGSDNGGDSGGTSDSDAGGTSDSDGGGSDNGGDSGGTTDSEASESVSSGPSDSYGDDSDDAAAGQSVDTTDGPSTSYGDDSDDAAAGQSFDNTASAPGAAEVYDFGPPPEDVQPSPETNVPAEPEFSFPVYDFAPPPDVEFGFSVYDFAPPPAPAETPAFTPYDFTPPDNKTYQTVQTGVQLGLDKDTQKAGNAITNAAATVASFFGLGPAVAAVGNVLTQGAALYAGSTPTYGTVAVDNPESIFSGSPSPTGGSDGDSSEKDSGDSASAGKFQEVSQPRNSTTLMRGSETRPSANNDAFFTILLAVALAAIGA